MANKQKAPKEVEDRHRAALAAAATLVAKRRQEERAAVLQLHESIREAFADDVTVGPIREVTGLSTPRLYQIKHEDPEAISA